jgi:proline-specific peptidase
MAEPSVSVKEGTLDFASVKAGKPCKTWYTVYGDLKSGKRPLLCLHGGPGLSHDYLLSLLDLASPPHNVPLIFYDQMGCGRSTHLPEKMRDFSFWTLELFLDELNNVITGLGIQDDYDIFGHSWGGMLGSSHAARQPKGLNKLILAGTPTSTAEWTATYRRYREHMPENYRKTLEEPRDYDTKDTPEYEEAMMAFFARHVITVNPPPEGFMKSFGYFKQDPTVGLST